MEDKIVQQAVVTILNEIYEVNFKGYAATSSVIRTDPLVGSFKPRCPRGQRRVEAASEEAEWRFNPRCSRGQRQRRFAPSGWLAG